MTKEPEDEPMPQSVGQMLEHTMEAYKRDETVKKKLQDRINELEYIVDTERKEHQMQYESMQSMYEDRTAETHKYSRAIVTQALHATWGICNLCGSITSKLSMMEQCGAVSDGHDSYFCLFTN